jgi:hypothetical protein
MNIFDMANDMKRPPYVSVLDNRQIPPEIDLSVFLEIREENGSLHPYLKLDGDNEKLLQIVIDIKDHLERLEAVKNSSRNKPIQFEPSEWK